jgi:hypothetical protein
MRRIASEVCTTYTKATVVQGDSLRNTYGLGGDGMANESRVLAGKGSVARFSTE